MPTAGKMCLAVDFNKRINRNGWLVQRVIRFSEAQIQEKIPSPFPVRGSIFVFPTGSNMILRKCWKFFGSTNRDCTCFPTFQHNFLNRGLYILFLFFYIPLYRRWKRKNVGNSPLTLLVEADFFQHTSNILYFMLEVFAHLLPSMISGAFS